MSFLTINGVSKSFGGLQALRDISFDVEQQEVVGLMGANGAGKTTLFSLIAGHSRPSLGSIHFKGRPIAALRPDHICRQGIARTFQIVRPFANMTVLDNVIVGALYGVRQERSTARAAASAMDILADLNLANRADDPASSLTLSGQKRLEIARALATGPELLMLDEVMAGLTATEVSELLDSIRRIKRRMSLTILMVEHVMQALMRLSDRVMVLHHGELIAQGKPQEIVADPKVIAAYLGPST
ncbi:MAG: ABC transporter ATP-binding protein [Xanthobacteraceae bacterium]|nr:MAG: ABC transporter ATP-binding protein [Xanthobacteraceae bacterium]